MKTVDLVNFRISGPWSRFLTLRHPARSHPPKSITSHFLLSKKGYAYAIIDMTVCRLLSSHYVALPCVVVSIYFFFPPATKNWHASATSVRVPLAYAYTYYALCYDPPSPPPRMFARCKRDRAYYSEFSFRPIGRFAWIRI